MIAAAQTTSAVTLAVTAGGAPVTTVRQGVLMTLTATVRAANGQPVSPGQVRFCEVKPAPRKCTDTLLLGMAQLLPNGLATFKFHPGAGTHTFQAQFVGTHLAPPAASAASQLIVTAYIPTTTTIAATGSLSGNYTMTATVTGTGGVIPPTGNVAFTDETNQGYTLATASLVPAPAGAGLSFAQVPTPAVYFETATINSADVNGDGWPDILWNPGCGKQTGPRVGVDGAEVDVLLGNGDGTFASEPAMPVYADCGTPIAIGDFNGDGILDIAVTTTPYSNNLAYLHIFLGNGDGTFSPGQIFYAPPSDALGSNANGQFIASVLAGDFNGDGIPDLLVTSSGNNGVTTYFGNGDGTFTPGPTSLVGLEPFPLLTADFNNDGIPDLVAYSEASSGTLVMNVLLGNGDGTFKPPTQLSFTDSYSAFAADINGDGNLDLVISAYSSTVVLLGNGDGTFLPAQTISATQAIVVADVNNDSYPDIVAYAIVSATSPSPISSFNVFLGNGDGTFQPPVTLSSGLVGPTRFAVADFNGDGQADIAAGTVDPFAGATEQYPLNMDVLLSEFNPQIATATVSPIFVLGSNNHTIEASYPGDTEYRPSSGTALVPANQEPTALTLTANLTTTAYGQPVQLTATLAPDALQNQIATGTVTFSYANKTLGTSKVSNGVATLSPTALPVGNDDVIAIYSGDQNFLTSGDDTHQIVSGYSSTTALTSSANPAGLGQPVTFTATVTGAGQTVPPTGTVAFFDGATQIGSAALNASGQASFTTATLALGSHPITAAYSGDTIFHPSTSPVATETIIPSDFSLTLSSPTVSLQTYQHTTATVQLTSLGAFSDTLTLACGNPPQYVTCVFTPQPANLTANSTATVSFYLDTDAILGGSARNTPPPGSSGGVHALALLLAPFSLFAALATGRRRPRPSLRLAALLSAATLAALTGCGGNQISPVPHAAPGTYTIPVTAAGSTTHIAHSANLTLTITP